MKQSIRISVLVMIVQLTLGCSEQVQQSQAGQAENNSSGRWYNDSQSSRGQQLFAVNCASCHGEKAQGTVDDWQRRLADGSLPPPPLNGTAHAWHHPLPVLLQVISEGGIPLGGKMPAFDEVLNQQDKLAVIAYFQSFWSDQIYQQWEQMGGVN